MASLMLGVLVVLGLAVACWAAFGAQAASQRAVVAGSAVVVSSLACPDGASGIDDSGIGDGASTLVDVQNPLGAPAPRMARASLDACGYQEGQQVAVVYAPGDPVHVTLAGSSGSGDAVGTGKRLLPFGIAIAGLLAVSAALAVMLDGRAHRRGRGSTAAHGQPDSPDAVVGGIAWFPRRSGITPAGRSGAPAERDGGELGATGGGVTGSADDSGNDTGGEGDGVGRGPLSVVTVLPAPSCAVVTDRSFSNDSGSGSSGLDERSPQLSSIDLVFPFSAGLAASLHDELFTHRSPVG